MKIDHIGTNATYWNDEAKGFQQSHPEHLEEGRHPSWGLGHIPEKDLGLLGGALVAGRTLVEMGCGRGHDAVGFANLGLEVRAIDISTEQLADRIEHPHVTYCVEPAEQMSIETESVDIVTSDHGAFDHSPPALLLKEARRVLRRDGLLAVCTYSPLAMACLESRSGRVSRQLQRPYATDRMRYDGKQVAAEYSYAGWIREFRRFGFVIERLEEVRSGEDACYFDQLVDPAWATAWPLDIAWVVRRT